MRSRRGARRRAFMFCVYVPWVGYEETRHTAGGWRGRARGCTICKSNNLLEFGGIKRRSTAFARTAIYRESTTFARVLISVGDCIMQLMYHDNGEST